jgi:hypothetical protein
MKKCNLCVTYIFFALIVFVCANESIAAVYYIDGMNGNDNNAGSKDLPWQTIEKANFYLNAGDTVYIKKGIYSSEQIAPKKSGSKKNYITYKNYNGDQVILCGHPVPIYLNNKVFIKIEGLKIENCVRFFVLYNGSNHNVITNCTFYKSRGYFGSLFSKFFINPKTGGRDKSISSNASNDYNKILNNNFVSAPDKCADGINQDCDTAPADFLYCEFGSYNIFQGNKFENCSHDNMVFGHSWTHHNIVRNNSFRNTYRRGLDIYLGTNYILIENNQFLDHGESATKSPRKGSRLAKPWKPGAIQCIKESKNIIIRKNVFINNGHVFSCDGEKKYFYNNTADQQLFTVFSDGGKDDFKSNFFINNIFSNTTSLNRPDDKSYVYSWITYVQPGFSIENNFIAYNIFTGDNIRWRYGNSTLNSIHEFEKHINGAFNNMTFHPEFIDRVNSNLCLSKESKVINSGAFLAKITSPTGEAKNFFTVTDAGYFYDGWGIATENGDVIKTQNGQTTRIKKINYENNILSVEPAIDIINGEGVSLQFNGDAPDIGAYEYNEKIVSINPPTGLTIK